MAHLLFDPPASISDAADRFKTMSIAAGDACTLPRDKRQFSTRDYLTTQDIPGAQPKLTLAAKELHNRPNFHAPTDIPGTTSKTLHPTLNKVSRVCTNADIEGSMPQSQYFSTNRVVDPLAPVYPLPKAEIVPAPEPKFMRDSHSITDIHGTSPAPLYKYKARDSHTVKDIPGTYPEWKPQNKQLLSGEARDILKVDDITKVGFKSQRVTDPLRPEYVVNGMRLADDDPKMRVKSLPKPHDGPTFSLTTQDIEGANAETGAKHTMPGGIPEDKRRQFRAINHVADIDGAATGTLKRTIVTKRVTDPNAREYPSLDGVVHEIPARLAHSLADPRDEEIARLRAQVDSLKKDVEIKHLEAELASLRRGVRSQSGVATPQSQGSHRLGSAAPWDRDETASRGGLRSSASQSSFGRPPASAQALGKSRSTATLPTVSEGSTFASSTVPPVERLASVHSGHGSEVMRLTTPASSRSLQSSASRRMAATRDDDVRSVRDLDTFTGAPSGLSRAGSASLAK